MGGSPIEALPNHTLDSLVQMETLKDSTTGLKKNFSTAKTTAKRIHYEFFSSLSYISERYNPIVYPFP